MSEENYLEQAARGLTKLSTAVQRVAALIMAEMIIILLDRSWSMEARCGRSNRLTAAKQAVIAMLDARRRLGAADQISIIAFNERARLVLPFTPCLVHRGRIEKAIQSIEAGGGTSLAAPLVLAGKIRPPEGCVHIVLLSDGHGGDAVAAGALKKHGALIETVGVGDNPSEVDESTLKQAASVLNGKTLYRFLSDADDVIEYFRTEVANRLAKRG